MSSSEVLNQAAQLQLQGNYQEALKLYQELMSADAQNPDLLHMYGVCLFQTGDLTGAESAISRSIEYQPDNDRVYTNLGSVLQAQQRWDDAQLLFMTALELQPANQDAMLGLGITSSRLGLSEIARTWLERFVLLNPMHRQAYLELSQVRVQGLDYVHLLRHFHEWLKPNAYVEIGVETGQSLTLASPPTNCVGIDPAPVIRYTLSASTRVFAETSDHFFQNHDLPSEMLQPTFDLAFIDGLHEFDAALRDFMNLERFAGPNSLVAIHDCFPIDAPSSSRNRSTIFWTGDTWRLVALLRKYRPDLTLFTFPANPSGLGIVMNLDPNSTVLIDNYDAIVAEFMTAEISSLGKNLEALNLVSTDVGELQQRIFKHISPCR